MDAEASPAEQLQAPAADLDKAEAASYLQSLVNKTLRVYTTDARLFVGTFKCTDPVCLPLGSYALNSCVFVLQLQKTLFRLLNSLSFLPSKAILCSHSLMSTGSPRSRNFSRPRRVWNRTRSGPR